MEDGYTLLPTLQTWCGMVQNNGSPAERPYPPTTSAAVLIETVVNKCSHLKQQPLSKTDLSNQTLLHNLNACTAAMVNKETLLKYMRREKRIDVEQAVALVLSLVPTNVAAMAFKTIESTMLNSAHMWLDDEAGLDDNEDSFSVDGRRLLRLRQFLSKVLSKEIGSDDELLPTLKRIRRKRTGLQNNQHLAFKKTLLDKLDEHEKSVWAESWRNAPQTRFDISSSDNTYVVSKNNFRRLQCMIYSLEGNTTPTGQFVKEVTKIEHQVRHSEAQMAALESTTDMVALAFSFMALQRRLQLKVVSNYQWTAFLKKGQGSELIQNRPDLVTSFEQVLAANATDNEALRAVRPPINDELSSSPTQNDELKQLVRLICEQMRKYVDVFGQGKFENLCYRQGTSGGSGRGPVDAYNLLVYLLGEVKTRSHGQIEVKPCYKFLAKDIMAWNNAWNDDAFASNRIPGWFYYLGLENSADVQYF